MVRGGARRRTPFLVALIITPRWMRAATMSLTVDMAGGSLVSLISMPRKSPEPRTCLMAGQLLAAASRRRFMVAWPRLWAR